MLGGIKVKGEGADAGISLFRILARKWKPVVRLKRKGVQFASMMPADHEPEPTRRWISKPRVVYAADVTVQAKSKTGWNPWQWIK